MILEQKGRGWMKGGAVLSSNPTAALLSHVTWTIPVTSRALPAPSLSLKA